jgi:hypothetical protein
MTQEAADRAQLDEAASNLLAGLRVCDTDNARYHLIRMIIAAAERRGYAAAYAAGQERMRDGAAQIVLSHQETTSNRPEGGYLSKRSHGNLVGLLYVDAIRALPIEEPPR